MSRPPKPPCEKSDAERRRERDEALALSTALFVCMIAMFVAVFS